MYPPPVPIVPTPLTLLVASLLLYVVFFDLNRFFLSLYVFPIASFFYIFLYVLVFILPFLPLLCHYF